MTAAAIRAADGTTSRYVMSSAVSDHSGILAEMMTEFGHTGRFNYRHAPGIVITALASLIAGGSLGLEAPLADACGSLGTLTADKLKLDEREARSLLCCSAAISFRRCLPEPPWAWPRI